MDPALPRLRELLRSPNARDREKALGVIRAIGQRAAPLLPDLLPLLADEDGLLRMLVAVAITSIGPSAASAVPACEECFALDAPRMRADLVDRASRFGRAAEPLLLGAMTYDVPWIRTSAVHQVFRLPRVSDKARWEIAARLVEPDDELATNPLNQMAQVPDLREPCSSGARQVVSRPDTGLRQACANVLFHDVARAMPRPSWQPAWGYADFTSLVGRWNVGVRAAEELAAFLDAAGITKWTLAFVAAEEPYTRLSAAVVLGQLPATPSTLAALRGLCEDDSAVVRAASALALGNLGPASREALPDLAKALTDPDWFVRAAAATSLRTLQVR